MVRALRGREFKQVRTGFKSFTRAAVENCHPIYGNYDHIIYIWIGHASSPPVKLPPLHGRAASDCKAAKNPTSFHTCSLSSA